MDLDRVAATSASGNPEHISGITTPLTSTVTLQLFTTFVVEILPNSALTTVISGEHTASIFREYHLPDCEVS
jgi:hypothetical protein